MFSDADGRSTERRKVDKVALTSTKASVVVLFAAAGQVARSDAAGACAGGEFLPAAAAAAAAITIDVSVLTDLRQRL